MPKLDTVFGALKNIDKLNITEVNTWLKAKEQNYILENYIGNKLLYPQTVPSDMQGLDTDLAIIREYIRNQPEEFYSKKDGKIYIPENYINRFPPLVKLIKAFLDIIVPATTTQLVVTKRTTEEYIGMIVRVPSEKDFFCEIDGQKVKILSDSIAVVSTQKQKVILKLEGADEMSIPAGEIGIIFDTRVVE